MPRSLGDARRPRLLLVYRSYSSFVRGDHDELAKAFEVRAFPWRGKRDLGRMLRAVAWSDVVYSWFALDHAAVATFFARLLGRRSVIVAGGVGVQAAPEIGYGRFSGGGLKPRLTVGALKAADLVLAVSDATGREVEARATPKRLVTVPNGIDVEAFRPEPGDPDAAREDTVLLIGSVTAEGVPLKGIKTFVETAARVPEARFEIVGPVDAEALSGLGPLPANLAVIGPLPHPDVAVRMRRVRVYCQVSFIESFGVAVAESMASGCVPVVSDRGFLPRLVGGHGEVVPYGDAEATAAAVRRALAASHDPVRRQAARRHVEEHFRIQVRGARLRSLVAGLLGMGAQGGVHEHGAEIAGFPAGP